MLIRIGGGVLRRIALSSHKHNRGPINKKQYNTGKDKRMKTYKTKYEQN
jgi:hypothetical protein